MCFVRQDDLSGADIKAICTEAGLLALRERRMKVSVLSVPVVLHNQKSFIERIGWKLLGLS